MEGMFHACKELENLDLSNWDTSNVTNMRGMFNQCYKLKEIKGLNKFITKKVESLEGMFQKCNELEYLDLSNWNISNVTNMNYMFNSCFKLKDIKKMKNKNLNKLLSVEGMFQLCIELESLDLSDFDTSNITNMNMMFASCKKLKSIKGINKFNTKKVEIMNAMFQLCYKLEYLD